VKCPECGATVDDRFKHFREIDWGRDAGEENITVETNVGNLSKAQRAAFLIAINTFVDELNKESAE